MNVSDIKERMEVFASCGKRVGVVDHVENGAIKLTKTSSCDGHHHLIPLDWVDHVDQHVHLNRDSKEVTRVVKDEPAGACS